ncbi:Histone acetyltransferase KAT7 [Labeo rohita]|uniref:Histone acetyltransferase KAT7 n=1 Tax=Labeo rohita TaxID=84645 RepID=A0ABQ8MU26_LABRO|nr:Histone acetyltransferase KAT7 [Labeo rohita]
MEVLYGYGISSTLYLQTHYGHAQTWFTFVSKVADLRTTFLFFFPIWFHLQSAVGVKLVWVAVVGDWLNLVLKWLMFGERPYWWVKETVYYGNSTVPQIKQFPMTCETGPGSPSGHTMGAAGVYYAMITSLLSILQSFDPLKRWCLQGLLWALFWSVQVCVSLSRVFIAAHFPHQSYVHTILCLVFVALGLYTLLDAASVDPYWSLMKAKKWCIQSEWVHLDTTPFAGLLRNTGALFGLGLSLHLPNHGDLEKNKSCGNSTIYRLTCTAATLPLLSLLDSFRPPTSTHALFYALSFCKSATVPLTTISFVPYCISTLANEEEPRRSAMPRRKRNAGSSSEGTEDSDFSAEHTDSSESDVHTVRNTRLTRSSLRLSRNSQDSSPVGSPSAPVSEEVVNYSTRRVTRSQQQGVTVLPKKYPLRQSRSSGSDTEQHGEISERDIKQSADHDESPPRTPTGNAPSSESDIDMSSPNVSHDERHLTGKHERHFSISGCPLYHNLSADECKVKASSRDKHVEERTLSQRQDENRHSARQQAQTERQLRYKEKVTEMRRKRNTVPLKEQKDKYTEHRQTHGSSREPLLENITSDYDLELFRKAQARASDDLEKLRLQGQVTEGGNMIKSIVFGRYELDTWYHSPYPEEYARLGRLYMCEFCLKYMKSQTILRRHMAKCVWKHPPGDEIYRKGAISPFLFYVMTEADNTGCHLVGYFSKEKNSFLNYNVSCILTMPQYMRQGYGKMLIDFSYLLSKVEEKVGSPERPLSDLGLISYRKISQETAVNPVDIVSTLQSLQMLKYWKGKHLILKRQDLIDDWKTKEAKRGSNKTIDPTALKWSPPKGT